MSLAIENNRVVGIHYTLKDDDGNTIDSSEGQDPLVYLHGAGNIIPGLEGALLTKVLGDKLSVRVEPKEGYGESQESLIQTIDKALFQGVDKIEEGMTFTASGPDGEQQSVVVVGVTEDKVTVDANHPLAGVALNFDVEVVSVREATEEEISHGHVH